MASNWWIAMQREVQLRRNAEARLAEVLQGQQVGYILATDMYLGNPPGIGLPGPLPLWRQRCLLIVRLCERAGGGA